jgi:processive rubber oxygenase RoxA-like protein
MGAQAAPLRVREVRKIARIVVLACVVLIVVAGLYFVNRFTSNSPVRHDDAVENFKYGSTGGEIEVGIPYSVWMALPEIFPELLPGKGGYASLGFLYEKGNDLPIGVSRRNVQGIDRVTFNCAICHVGSYRTSPEAAPQYVVGMPSNTVDLRAFYEFLFKAANSEKFNPGLFLAEIKRQNIHEDLINRMVLRFYGIYAMQNSLIARRDRLAFILDEPAFGPGRIDTFNPAKALLNFRMDLAPAEEKIGTTDLPSVWNQRQREGMHLHWDGNNNSVEERNRSAAFGTGAYPPTLDRAQMRRIADFLLDAKPPKYPFPIDEALAARGSQIYAQLCAYCHGKNGNDFHAGEGALGTVTPIQKIGTDPWRLDSYTYDLAVNQNLLYSGYGEERFSHFRKTYGYANMPLDGIWLRAPYLHNGSVPNLRALLEPSRNRPQSFYRGDDVYNPADVGFAGNVAERNGRKFFLYDTAINGNGRQGHEGKTYGTELGRDDKNALIEYLKKF